MDNIYLNKLIKKIKLKECEYETIKAMIDNYSSLVEKLIDDIFLSEEVIKEEILKSSIYHVNANANANANIKCGEILSIIPEYDNLVNTLYKNLCLKTHPDKTNGDDIEFKNIMLAYENKNILKLIEYSKLYNLLSIENINIHLLTLILEKQFFTLKNKVKNLKNTTGYHILISENAYGTQAIRELINMYKINEKLSKENGKLKMM
jgi:hypothetical protein